MSEPSQPGAADFLAYSGPAERNGWRVAFWFGLGLALAWFGLSLIQMTIALVDKELLEAADKTAGPLRRAADLGILSLVFAEAYAAWLFAARFVFQRPAWTFVTPVRRFSLLRLGCGLGVGAVFGAGAVMIRLLSGKDVLPFIADLRIADAERFGYLGAGLVFALLLHASMEGFFRGLVPQVVGAFTRSRLVITLVSGAVAAAIIPHSGPLDAAAEFALGVGLTWAVLELAGVEYAIGAQVATTAVDLAVSGPGPAKTPDMTWWGLAYYVIFALTAAGGATLLKRRLSRSGWSVAGTPD